MLRGFQWDLGRQVERLDWLLAQLPRYAGWGYNELYLHLEDAVEFPSVPGVARPDAYTYRQMERLVSAATRVGINVVPIVNLLGHTQYLIKVPELRDLNELRCADGGPAERGQICPVHPRTLELAEKLLRDMAPFCTAGKVHVGLDESFHLGRHPLSRREIESIGLPAHFARYVGKLRDLAASLGLRTGLWADMLYFLPGAIPLLPRDVIAYEWYYYPFKRRPKVELFNFAESNVGERLRARGIEYWGCPMNGAFRFEPLPHFTDRLENILSWWKRCQRLDAAGMLITSWEPFRLAIELTTVVDAAAASLWLDGLAEPRAMLERGFARVFGRKTAKAAARAALACDRHPFSGYPRWEINARWDVISRRDPIAPYRTEERHFAGLRQRSAAEKLPRPLRDSIDLRWYLAARDVAVRELYRGADSPGGSHSAATPGRRLSKAIPTGLRAAQAMWARTRDRSVRSPNEAIVRADRERLNAIRDGKPGLQFAWQLCYRVRNVEPAVQIVAVEQLIDGIWHVRQACPTIEFQSGAAVRRSGLVREHAATIAWDGSPGTLPSFRLVVRGVGRVRIEAIALTDGKRTLPGAPTATYLGRKAPRRALPKLDLNLIQDAVAVSFASTPRRTRPASG